MLFEFQKYRPPLDFNNNNNMVGVIISNIIKEENIAIQQAPLDNVILAEIQQMVCESNNSESDCSLLANIVTLGRNISPWVSKYAQTTQSKVNHRVYSSGCHVIKAFITEYSVFFDKSKCQLKDINDSSFNIANSVRITWRIQKNRQNGQTVTFVVWQRQPQSFPCYMCIKDDPQSKKIEVAWQHATWVLLHEKNTHGVHDS